MRNARALVACLAPAKHLHAIRARIAAPHCHVRCVPCHLGHGNMLQKALADASISKSFVADMNRFAQEFGILTGDVPYENVVATQFRYLWKA
jgi:hypothetical protein